MQQQSICVLFCTMYIVHTCLWHKVIWKFDSDRMRASNRDESVLQQEIVPCHTVPHHYQSFDFVCLSPQWPLLSLHFDRFPLASPADRRSRVLISFRARSRLSSHCFSFDYPSSYIAQSISRRLCLLIDDNSQEPFAVTTRKSIQMQSRRHKGGGHSSNPQIHTNCCGKSERNLVQIQSHTRPNATRNHFIYRSIELIPMN